MKARILYFDAKKIIRLDRKKVKDGIMKGKGQGKNQQIWHIDKEKFEPYIFERKSFFGLRKKIEPLYLVSYKDTFPICWDENVGKLEHKLITPENASNMMEQGLVRQLLAIGKLKSKEMIMYLILGAIIGFLAGYIVAGIPAAAGPAVAAAGG